MSKIILLDGGALTHRAIFMWNQSKQLSLTKEDMLVMPSHYTYFSMIISNLKKIGTDKDDIIIIALEGHSWRKDYDANYKAQRKDYREKHELIDWNHHYKKIDEVNKQLEEATNWHFLRFSDFGEADDVIAVSCRFFKDKEIIIVTSDKDLYQLTHYPNVKVFSLNLKCKNSRGMYAMIPDPLKIIHDKAKKGDVSDNILVSPNDTDEDFELRYTLVNLLELPDFVEKPIVEKLENLPEKELQLSELPFPNSLAQRFTQIYDKKNVITYDYCKQLQEKRDEKRKKKAKEKYQLRKKEKISGQV